MDSISKKNKRKTSANQEFKKEVARMPISKKNLKKLFDFLNRPNSPDCDETLKNTIQFLNDNGLDKESIIPWLNEYGGYCDCSVFYDVEDKWGEYVRKS